MTETVELMEPLLPPENASELNDLSLDLATKASAFAGMLNPVTQFRHGLKTLTCF